MLATVKPVNMTAMADAFAIGRDKAGRHNRPDAEEGTMGKRGEYSRGHEETIARRQGTGSVAGNENGHQGEQHGFARPAGGQHRQYGSADDDAECISGDQKARRSDRYAEIGTDLQQQSHDDEFRDADAEGTGCQGIESQRHVLSHKVDVRDRR